MFVGGEVTQQEWAELPDDRLCWAGLCVKKWVKVSIRAVASTLESQDIFYTTEAMLEIRSRENKDNLKKWSEHMDGWNKTLLDDVMQGPGGFFFWRGGGLLATKYVVEGFAISLLFFQDISQLH